jgi:zinc protease
VPKGQLNLAAEGSVSAEIVEEDITKPVQVDIETETEEEIIKTPSGFDRSVAPVPGPDPEIKLPLVWNSVYPNGMKIHGIGRHELPIIACSLTIRGGTCLMTRKKQVLHNSWPQCSMKEQEIKHLRNWKKPFSFLGQVLK